jgi:cell surface protein SprA
MLKSNLTNVKNPVWNLMMKNIYQIPGAYQVKQEDFRFNILYTDPSPLNYIIEAKMQLEMQCHFHLIPLR